MKFYLYKKGKMYNHEPKVLKVEKDRFIIIEGKIYKMRQLLSFILKAMSLESLGEKLSGKSHRFTTNIREMN